MSTLRVTNLQSAAGTQNVTQDRLYSGAATAWVNFDGTGTVAIRDSYNVSSITDNGVGDYTVNFQTALANANYSFVGSGQVQFSVGITTQATGSVRFTHGRYSTGNVDYSNICVAIFGGY
jgi:hypothetical protein